MSATTAPLLVESDERGTIGNILHELSRIAKNPRGALSLTGIGALCIFAIFVPILWDVDPNWIERVPKNQTPSWEHPMGTDHISRDLLARNAAGLGRTVTVSYTHLTLPTIYSE